MLIIESRKKCAQMHWINKTSCECSSTTGWVQFSLSSQTHSFTYSTEYQSESEEEMELKQKPREIIFVDRKMFNINFYEPYKCNSRKATYCRLHNSSAPKVSLLCRLYVGRMCVREKGRHRERVRMRAYVL